MNPNIQTIYKAMLIPKYCVTFDKIERHGEEYWLHFTDSFLNRKEVVIRLHPVREHITHSDFLTLEFIEAIRV